MLYAVNLIDRLTSLATKKVFMGKTELGKASFWLGGHFFLSIKIMAEYNLAKPVN